MNSSTIDHTKFKRLYLPIFQSDELSISDLQGAELAPPSSEIIKVVNHYRQLNLFIKIQQLDRQIGPLKKSTHL
tara:strand:- start:1956 stop:2177 length:222 start_codon:yes stop_codon:yes gene_type:complete